MKMQLKWKKRSTLAWSMAFSLLLHAFVFVFFAGSFIETDSGSGESQNSVVASIEMDPDLIYDPNQVIVNSQKQEIKVTSANKASEPRKEKIRSRKLNTQPKVAERMDSQNLNGSPSVNGLGIIDDKAHTVTKSFRDMVIYEFSPKYPRLAIRQGWEDKLRLRLRVDTQGEVREVNIIQNARREIFHNAVLQAARSWKFKKANTDSGYFVEREIVFRLRN